MFLWNPISLNFWFLIFIEFSISKSNSNFNNSHTISLKIMKLPWCICVLITSFTPNFSNIWIVGFIEFSLMEIFQIPWLLHCSSKHYKNTLKHPYSLRAFQRYQEHSQGPYDLADLIKTNDKTNQTNNSRIVKWKYKTKNKTKQIMMVSLNFWEVCF